jgi:hypothetical protein
VLRIYSGGVAPGQILMIPPTLMGIPVIFTWGLLLSGVLIGPEVSFMFLTLSSYILFAFVPAQASQIYILDALPISRRALFSALVLPNLILLGAGYASGVLIGARAEPVPAMAYQADRTRLFPEDRHEQPLVRVSYAACRMTWSGEVPLITSPWGETHPAWSEPLFKNGSVQLYSPFATRQESSSEFQALMISRAIHHVYGHAIAPDEIQRRYLEDDHGRFTLEREISTLLTDYPQLGTPLSPRPASIYFLVVTLIYLLMVAIYTRALRTDFGNLGRKVFMFSLMGAILLLHVVQLTLAMAGLLQIDVLGGLMLIGSLYLEANVPGGLIGLWVACLLLTLIGYRWAESRFQRIEAPMGPLCRGGGEAL